MAMAVVFLYKTNRGRIAVNIQSYACEYIETEDLPMI